VCVQVVQQIYYIIVHRLVILREFIVRNDMVADAASFVSNGGHWMIAI